MKAAEWPIRVGGEYPTDEIICPQTNSATYARVLAIDGADVHFESVRVDRGDGKPHVYREHSLLSAPVFRRLHAPGDQSPLPRMYTLLDKLAFVECLPLELRAEIDALTVERVEIGGSL